MSQTPIAATHVVFAPPRILNGALYRGVVATDVPDTIGQQLDRDLWVVLLLLHGASVPTFHVDIDLYLTSLTYADKCPHPQLHLTDRNFINENKFFPLSLPKQYDVIFNANWMTLKTEHGGLRRIAARNS